MSIPERCTALVVGGGPGGSYTATLLAREGIDTVLLEADTFPRYHIGESLLPSFRNFMRFIELDQEFDNHGFFRKVGASFKFSPANGAGFTDFIGNGGPDNYAWNVIRSEADHLIFKHAGKSGAKTFDGVKVTSIEFDAPAEGASATNPGRPISVSYTRKSDGVTGSIGFDYIVDASGRAGLLSTKYLKNRHYSTMLKNVANWVYYKEAELYEHDVEKRKVPLFEALHDQSGWSWFIPLHNGTVSVGVVRNQAIATEKKKAAGSTQAYWDESLKLSPILSNLLRNAVKDTEIKSASDYSYHSSAYSVPYARVVGDAGCFIDPLFSSGVHLALTGGLAAATTICASIRGDVAEEAAAKWHSRKIQTSYTRFLLVVLSAYKQMMHQDELVLSEKQNDNFGQAFKFFEPVIQGKVDVSSSVSQTQLADTVNFLASVMNNDFVKQTLTLMGEEEETGDTPKPTEMPSEDQVEVLMSLHNILGGAFLGLGDDTTDAVDGRAPLMERGKLTLIKVQSEAAAEAMK